MIELFSGDVIWAALGPVADREQSGHRPVVVVASTEYLDIVDTLAIVVPVTTRDREWSNHILLTGPTGLDRPSWAMTEQPLTLSRERMTRRSGRIDDDCVHNIRLFLRDFLDL